MCPVSRDQDGTGEFPAGNQAFGQTQGHGGVVGPLAGLQAERSTAHHVVNGLKGSGRFEFQRRAQRVSGRQAQQAALVAIFGTGSVI